MREHIYGLDLWKFHLSSHANRAEQVQPLYMMKYGTAWRQTHHTATTCAPSLLAGSPHRPNLVCSCDCPTLLARSLLTLSTMVASSVYVKADSRVLVRGTTCRSTYTYACVSGCCIKKTNAHHDVFPLRPQDTSLTLNFKVGPAPWNGILSKSLALRASSTPVTQQLCRCTHVRAGPT
jgi:hypothetical protein